MKICITIPPLEELLIRKCAPPLARKGKKWRADCLGDDAKQRGIYIIHQSKTPVLYIGKTGKQAKNKRPMDFATRLRRHFTESGSGKKGKFKDLLKAKKDGTIYVSFLYAAKLPKLIEGLADTQDDDALICVMEAAMIRGFRPEFQIPERRAISN